ncbi:hypothetical protein LEP1GSC192_1007 [Leptospira sp. B5-022]|nr:hypothetical protein LEP1GSC192_1007 [Leptospira sp. B5-022]
MEKVRVCADARIELSVIGPIVYTIFFFREQSFIYIQKI